MKSLTIAGKKTEIYPLNKDEQKGLWLELIANFEIGKIDFNGNIMILFEYKSKISYTPLQLKKLSERIENTKNLPAVFYYEHLLTYERDRLIEQGVYFVVSDKYAFIPSLIINRKESANGIKKTFFPSTQYILLYHLQIDSIIGKTLKELEEVLPYKYPTIARSINQLQQLGFISLYGGKEKKIEIESGRKELWKKAQTYLVVPVKGVYYTTEPLAEGLTANISALSHYSLLAPEDIPTKAITPEYYSKLKKNGFRFLTFEDMQRIEVWKYPPLETNGYVDRLSLFLTLKDDRDPRVEKELETMINEIPW